jgi:hypothetical protein
MTSERFNRQSFLGVRSEEILRGCRIAVVGLGGGGSHIAQQLAHIGIGRFVLVDPDVVEESNLNRLVGATATDVAQRTPKVDVAAHLIGGVNPAANIVRVTEIWQNQPDSLRDCDVIFACVDSFNGRDQLERFARRFLIPFIDIGMDVTISANHHAVAGQVAISLPAQPCLWCMGLLTTELLELEAQKYGQAGGRPQVIWPNGVLASTAVGIFVNLVTPWHDELSLPILLEYDGDAHTAAASNKVPILKQMSCKHYPAADVGDPFYEP